MTWVRMDDSWPFNRKLLHVDPPERLMWAMSIAYASSQNTDGKLDLPMVRMLSFLAGVDDVERSIARLVHARLWEQNTDGWSVHDYLEFNFTAAERADQAARKADAGRRGAQRRWQADGNGMAPPMAGAMASAMAGAMAPPMAGAWQSDGNVPSRPVPSQKSSVSQSSGRARSRRNTGDDDDDLVEQTIKELGRRDHDRALAEGVTVRNRAGHLAACVDKRRAETAAVAALAAANPEWPPERVADELEDPGGAERRAGRERALKALEREP